MQPFQNTKRFVILDSATYLQIFQKWVIIPVSYTSDLGSLLLILWDMTSRKEWLDSSHNIVRQCKRILSQLAFRKIIYTLWGKQRSKKHVQARSLSISATITLTVQY